jgi:phage shock protein A
MKDQLVKKYQLEVKDLFEADYHKIITDEDLVERLIKEVQKLSSDVPDLENILQEAHEDLYEAECTIDRLRDEIDELKIII